jgi:hypothetical protein
MGTVDLLGTCFVQSRPRLLSSRESCGACSQPFSSSNSTFDSSKKSRHQTTLNISFKSRQKQPTTSSGPNATFETFIRLAAQKAITLAPFLFSCRSVLFPLCRHTAKCPIFVCINSSSVTMTLCRKLPLPARCLRWSP